MRKRKAALALSAGAMGLSTAAMGVPTYLQQKQPVSDLPAAQPDLRRPAALLQSSESLKEALIQEEGVHEVVYRDVAGYPTVGVGHLVKSEDGLSVGQRISEEKVLDLLDQDLKIAETAAARLVGDLRLYQHEFDALVDLIFNVGEGNVSPSQSPRLNQAIASRDYDAVARELNYTTAAGAVANGLVYRSERRANIFTGGQYADPREMA